MVNLDLSATAFYQKGSLTEMVVKILNLRSAGGYSLVVEHLPMTKTIINLNPN